MLAGGENDESTCTRVSPNRFSAVFAADRHPAGPSDVLENSIYLDVEGQVSHHRQESEVFSRVAMTITSVITSKAANDYQFKAEQRKVPGTKMFVPCHCLFREV
jgi:hypothetical protein